MSELANTAASVAFAVLPLVALFLVFQRWFLGLPWREVRRILAGTLMASAGLFLFLLGVDIGFLPFGRAIGEALGTLHDKWLLLPFGLLLGYVTTWGEPAVRVLADQVEDATAGSIRGSLVLHAVCGGVALAVGIGLLRIGYAIPLLWLLVPGYAVVLAILWLSKGEFIGIAVDAGGVATGPLANTFLLAVALGASSAASGRISLEQGLGLVALICVAPVISLMALGIFIRWKERRQGASSCRTRPSS